MIEKYMGRHSRNPVTYFNTHYVIDDSTGCWLWTGSVMPIGYGQLSVFGRNISAHRFSFELYKSSVPPGMDIDHLCRARKCVNPAHLEIVSRSTNLCRGHQAIKNGAPRNPLNPYNKAHSKKLKESKKIT